MDVMQPQAAHLLAVLCAAEVPPLQSISFCQRVMALLPFFPSLGPAQLALELEECVEKLNASYEGRMAVMEALLCLCKQT
ncbi:hypothetical protein AC579_419 [Pseudocercospora musae]|uniref:Uncharacterized protein n=1 Tax=Pseudocercospora musae TaxID=113226 RepID=A0A139HJI0_9PEZI|nr:hypothetical protein AC579_419 [Pseudocercospora musae]